MKYFVSYTTIDKEVSLDLLKSFAKKLENHGEVFIDILHNDSHDRQARIIAEIDQSDILILIESKSVGKSKWVGIEIAHAESMEIPIKKISIESLEETCINDGHEYRPCA